MRRLHLRVVQLHLSRDLLCLLLNEWRSASNGNPLQPLPRRTKKTSAADKRSALQPLPRRSKKIPPPTSGTARGHSGPRADTSGQPSSSPRA